MLCVWESCEGRMGKERDRGRATMSEISGDVVVDKRN